MMRPLRLISPLLVLVLTPFLASVGEDAQVIRSGKSVLTIYSYGTGEARRIAPEVPERDRRHTAALTDVVAQPPLSSALPLRPRTSTVESKLATPALTTDSGARTAKMTSASSSMQSSLTIPSTGPSILFLEWQASPDESVVGYNVYTGTTTHQYSNKQTLGNQTFTALSLDQGTAYVAVSAYTAEGIESRLSDELVVSPAIEDGGITSAAIGTGAGSQ